MWSAGLVCGILPVNFHIKWSGSCDMLKCISIAHARAKCGPRVWPAAFYLSISVKSGRLAQSLVLASGARHFPYKFLYKVALVKC